MLATDPSVQEIVINGKKRTFELSIDESGKKAKKTVGLLFGEGVSKRNQKRFTRVLANTRFLDKVKRSGNWVTGIVKSSSLTSMELLDEITTALAGALENSRSMAKAAFAKDPEFDVVVANGGTITLKAHRSLNGAMNYINNPHRRPRRQH